MTTYVGDGWEEGKMTVSTQSTVFPSEMNQTPFCERYPRDKLQAKHVKIETRFSCHLQISWPGDLISAQVSQIHGLSLPGDTSKSWLHHMSWSLKASPNNPEGFCPSRRQITLLKSWLSKDLGAAAVSGGSV